MTPYARRLTNRCDRAFRRAVIAVVRGYQVAISPLLGSHCRFQPTCSQYCIEVIRRDGVFRGGIRAFYRIARCHPWNPGGYDPP